MSYGMQYAGGRAKGVAGVRSDAAALERMVRPFESPRILALRARRKALEENLDEAEIIWGGPSETGSATQTAEEDRRGFRIVNPKPEKDPAQDKPVLVYSEVSRTTETVRVTNPQDSNQWVDVARIKSITFRGPDGIDRRFDLKPPR